jgi:hypothetical protein
MVSLMTFIGWLLFGLGIWLLVVLALLLALERWLSRGDSLTPSNLFRAASGISVYRFKKDRDSHGSQPTAQG